MPLVSEEDVASEATGEEKGGLLSRDDCRCPVCLEILLEPVTLPCHHTFCKVCFLESVDKATMCCPLCRKRISSWARLHGRNKTLVNELLWKKIQATFPLQCQRRLSGQDGGDDDGDEVAVPRVCQPGELRQEYEDQINKLAEEKRSQEETERRASEEYIQRLLAEEEERLAQERRRCQENQQEDERLAMRLCHELNSIPSSHDNLHSAVTPARKKLKASAGQMEKFLFPLPLKSGSPDSSFLANKENILQSQKTLQSSSREAELPGSGPYRSYAKSGDAAPSSAKRTSSELEMEEEVPIPSPASSSLFFQEEAARGAPSTSSLFFQEVAGGAAAGKALQDIMELEAELFSRRQQEEEDLRLARLLQTELNREETRRATDRRKGSADAYLLRAKAETRTSTSAGLQPIKPKSRSSSSSSAIKKTPKTSNSSSSSSSNTSCKQTTLTEIFPYLGS